jgi:hypothetical protein
VQVLAIRVDVVADAGLAGVVHTAVPYSRIAAA